MLVPLLNMENFVSVGLNFWNELDKIFVIDCRKLIGKATKGEIVNILD
jgi:hypothetical protein